MSDFLTIFLSMLATLILVAYIIYSEYRSTCVMQMEHIVEFGLMKRMDDGVEVVWNNNKVRLSEDKRKIVYEDCFGSRKIGIAVKSRSGMNIMVIMTERLMDKLREDIIKESCL